MAEVSIQDGIDRLVKTVETVNDKTSFTGNGTGTGGGSQESKLILDGTEAALSHREETPQSSDYKSGKLSIKEDSITFTKDVNGTETSDTLAMTNDVKLVEAKANANTVKNAAQDQEITALKNEGLIDETAFDFVGKTQKDVYDHFSKYKTGDKFKLTAFATTAENISNAYDDIDVKRKVYTGFFEGIIIRNEATILEINIKTELPTFDLLQVQAFSTNTGKDIIGWYRTDLGDYQQIATINAINRSETRQKAFVNAQIKYEKGRVLSYAEQKTTGVFADRTLFSETLIKEGYAIVGGTGGVETTGSVGAHKHLSGQGQFNGSQDIFPYLGENSPLANGTRFSHYRLADGSASSVSSSMGYTSENFRPSETSNDIETDVSNLPTGHKLIKYVYTALKDITNGEME